MHFAATMTARSFILIVIGFSGLLGMEGCGSTHTITFLYMAAPSAASDPQHLAALISGRAQPSADGASGRALKRTLSDGTCDHGVTYTGLKTDCGGNDLEFLQDSSHAQCANACTANDDCYDADHNV